MTVYEKARRKIDGLLDPIRGAILGGAPSNLHDYHRLVGKYEGIMMAFSEIEDLLKDDIELEDTGR